MNDARTFSPRRFCRLPWPKRLVALCAVLPGLTFAAASPGSDDEAFLSARDAFARGELMRLARAGERLSTHPLKPWADYWLLRTRLDDGDSTGIPAFLQAQAGSYLADRLRSDWLRKLGEQADWEGFRRESAALVEWEKPVRCYAARGDDNVDLIRPMLAEPRALPDPCFDVLEDFVHAGRVDRDELWLHFRRLNEKKLRTDASKLAPLLIGEHLERKALARTLDDIYRRPARYLSHLPAAFAQHRNGRELALVAVLHLALSEPDDAAAALERIAPKLERSEAAYGWGQIALQGALRQLPQAQAWFALARDDATLTDEQLAWRARVALRVQDWRGVESAIAGMPGTLADKPDWIYWQGRSLMAQGKPAEARGRFERIAGQANFYGNLAEEELGRLITLPPRTRPGATELATVAAMPGVQRAMALIRLDMRNEGIKEWSFAMRGLSDKQLLAAAELARNEEVWDRAINAAVRTQQEHDFSLRFLAPYREHVQGKAEKLDLDGGWVYGLLRQESRFVMRAKSNVGAQGLMQVMPATAKWVAKKINLSGYQPSRIAELDTNVTLGTNYLKMVLTSLDNHPVLASAAYNAGPGRARRWRADVPLEGAIYAETIPFNETRDYVKNVMSNAVYYKALFEGRGQSLKSLLGVVRAKGSGENGVEVLP